MEAEARLISNIRELVDLQESDVPVVLAHFKAKTLRKKEYLLVKDEVSRHMRFIAKGSLRSFYIDNLGREHVLQLGIEAWWINDLYSYLTQTPAKHYVQAVEDSIVMQIHRNDLETLFKTIPVTERFFRLKIQKGYVSLQERIVDGMSHNTEERYQEFISKYRHLEQRFPQYMIASYLGVTPEFLSALRKKILTS